MLQDATLNHFQQRITDLPDRPNMTPEALKSRFDACPEELRIKHNALIADLQTETASAQIGFHATAGIPAENVQSAIEQVHEQLQDFALGAIPDGSIGYSKLDQPVRDTLAGLQQGIHTEVQQRTDAINARIQAEQALQAQISTKCELVFGTYTGNEQPTQYIHLGFTPKALLVVNADGINSWTYGSGGIAVGGGMGIYPHHVRGFSFEVNGFTVFYDMSQRTFSNAKGTFSYIAVR